MPRPSRFASFSSGSARAADIRSHRIQRPNRRPLLVAAVLVLATSAPTLVAIVAGTYSLQSPPTFHPPAAYAPDGRPIVVDPAPSLVWPGQSPGSGVGSGATVAEPVTAHPPLRPRSSGTGGGDGAGFVPESYPTRRGVPGSGSGSAALPAPAPSTSSPSPTPSAPEVCPTSTPPPGQRWDDRAWPGWDRPSAARPESTAAPAASESTAAPAAPTAVAAPEVDRGGKVLLWRRFATTINFVGDVLPLGEAVVGTVPPRRLAGTAAPGGLVRPR